MRSSSAERRAPRAGVPSERGGLRPWARLALGAALAGGALLGPAMGFASAQFGDTATVTISITVPPTAPTATAAPGTPAAATPAPGPSASADAGTGAGAGRADPAG